MPHVLHSVPWDFDLVEEDDGRLMLTVVCGTIGIFEVVIELNEDERTSLLEKGRDFVIDLKNLILEDPASFSDRNLNRSWEAEE